MSPSGARAPSRFDLRTAPLHGVSLIEASAGTGKTHALAGLFVRLLAERKLSVREILVVTFTDAATAELRERIRGVLASALRFVTSGGPGIPRYPELDEILARNRDAAGIKECLRDAVRSFDEAEVSTIHGFCRSVLAQSAFESGVGFSVELVPDQRELVQEVTDDFWRTRVLTAPAIWLRRRRALGRFARGPDGLVPLLRRRSLDPRLRLLPEGVPPEAGELESREAAVCSCFTALKRDWAAGEPRLRGLILDYDGWNGTTFSPTRRQAFLDAAAELFARDDPWESPLLKAACELAQESLAAKVRKGKQVPRDELFDRVGELARAAAALDDGLMRFEYALERDYLVYAPRELATRGRRRGSWSFDDLVRLTYEALHGEGGEELAARLGARYKVALIDEFQDTDPLQYRIFFRAFGAGTLYLIGDPKQAIYGFRGADIHAYLGAARHAAQTLRLTTNHRSTPALVGAVNSIFGGHQLPFIHPGIGFQDSEAAVGRAPNGAADRAGAGGAGARSDAALGGPGLIFMLPEGDEQLNKGLALRLFSEAASRTVARLLAEERYEPRQLAVLVRFNRQAKAVQAALRSLGVPGVLYTADSVFASDEAGEMERVLAALAHPGSETLLRSALCTRMLGFDAARLDAVDGAELDRRMDRLHALSAIWRDRGFMRALRVLLDEEGVRERILGLADGERRLTNVLHVGELLHLAEGGLHLGVEELEAWLGERRASGWEEEEGELRLETDEEAVTIATIHHAKGLEYDVVLCPFLWDGMQPEKSGAVSFHDEDGVPVLDLAVSSAAVERSSQESLAEMMRLAYVALTRAKKACYVYWGRIREAATCPLFYLLHCRDMGKEGIAEGGGLTAELGARWRALSAADLRQEVGELASSIGGSVAVLPFDGEVAPVPRSQAGTWTGEAKQFSRPSWRSWGITSYTGLTRGHHREGRERDRDVVAAVAPPPAGEGGIIAFPRGAAAGTFIHAMLEEADLAAAVDERQEQLLAARCRESGYESSWAPALAEMVREIGAAPLRGTGEPIALRDLGRGERLVELEFYLPVSHLDPPTLAAAFAASPEPFRAAAPALAELGFGELRGFLQGFIDLVFRAGERYYILDWKSNYLGPTEEDYGPEALAHAMAENRYDLQLCLYSLALHLYLRRRVPSYDYERDFGGVFYVFVRGVRAPSPGQGVYWARPPLPLVERLEEVLLGGSDG